MRHKQEYVSFLLQAFCHVYIKSVVIIDIFFVVVKFLSQVKTYRNVWESAKGEDISKRTVPNLMMKIGFVYILNDSFCLYL